MKYKKWFIEITLTHLNTRDQIFLVLNRTSKFFLFHIYENLRWIQLDITVLLFLMLIYKL